MSKIPPAGGFVRGKKYVVTLNTAHVGWNDAIQDSRDSQIYQYKTIGTQVWMTENLAYLPSVVGPGTGSNSTAYYYVYGYDGTDVDAAKATSNYTTYGVLYNWPAAMSGAASSSADPSGVQGICPTGWHLPSDAEWTTLTDYLEGESVAGGKMKEADSLIGPVQIQKLPTKVVLQPFRWLPFQRWHFRHHWDLTVTGGVLRSTIQITPGTAT